MDRKAALDELGLSVDDAIVIGSGILGALRLRESQDIDLVVTEAVFANLAANDRCVHERKRGRDLLVSGLLEVGTSWNVLNKVWRFSDLLAHSVIIDDVRYIALEFLLDVKRSWLTDAEVRQKDRDDVRLIERYFASRP